MRRERLVSIMRRCRGWLPLSTRHSPGQVAIYMAMILTSLMGLAGAGVDYGLIVIESSRLQNSLDAAALAGARALATSTGATQALRNADGQAAAANYLGLHGYVNGTNGATFVFTPSASDEGAFNDTMKIDGTVVRETRFWKVIGINSTTLSQTSTAVASGGMVDVMISLDLTGSMEMSGYNDMGNLRDAVLAFLDQMQISATNPRGTRVGIARWAGVNCSWYRGTSSNPPYGQANNDRYIDWNRGPSNSTGEYVNPCHDDATVLSYLSQDRAKLDKIVNNSGGISCPSAPAWPATPTPNSPDDMSDYGCPLQSWRYPWQLVPQVHGTPTTKAGVQDHNWSGMTGTKLSNAIKIVNGSLPGGCYAWGTSTTACPTNGRNDPASADGLARKVLVIMTDGFSQSGTEGLPQYYPTYTTVRTPVAKLQAPDSWDNEAIDLADRLKRGPDNDINTTHDNVEVYVVGFFPVPYSNSSSSSNWARSRAAAYGTVAAGTHPCPAPTLPSVGSNRFSYASNSVAPGVDELLNTIASSTPGSCDHYFPIAKSEGSSLPQLFRVMAGSIARGRLQ